MAKKVFILCGDGLQSYDQLLVARGGKVQHSLSLEESKEAPKQSWAQAEASQEGASGTLQAREVKITGLRGSSSLQHKAREVKITGLRDLSSLQRKATMFDQVMTVCGPELTRVNRELGSKILGMTRREVREYMRLTSPAIRAREPERLPSTHNVMSELTKMGKIALEKPSGELSQPIPCGTSTREFIDKFLAAKKGKLRLDSITSYRAVLRPFARAYPELPLEPEQIEAYLDNFSHENTTAQYKFSVLRTFYLWLSRRNLIDVNPIKMMDPPGGQADEILPLNEEQVRLLHDMPKTDREQGYIGLMLDHGFRLSEMLRLDVGDIHEDRIWIHGKERREWFPLLSEVRGWLLKLADGRGPGEPLFVGRQGRLSDSQVQSDIKRLLQRAGINDVRQSPHTLRHTFSTLAYLAGCDWDAVELLLRQKEKKRNVTNRYIHLSPEQRLRLMRERLEAYSPLRTVYDPLSWAKSQIIPSSASADAMLYLEGLTEAEIAKQLLPQFLDQLVTLGQIAHNLRHALSGNGHQLGQLKEIKHQASK